MRTRLFTILVLFALLIPMVAACGQAQPAAPAPTEPAAPTAAAPTEAPAATAAPAAATAAPAATAASGAAPAATAVTTGTKKLRVGLVTDIGKVNDGTFNQFAYEGAKRAADEFGLEFRYIETIAQADYAQNIQTLVDEKYDIIVTVGFLITDATLAAAQANPDITFIGVDQFFPTGDPPQSASNLVGTQFREDQSGFLAGAMAAMMSESGTIGIVAGLKIPPVEKFRNGYINGAKYVRPDIRVLDYYAKSFTDPEEGGRAAQTMIGEGADVIFGAGGKTGSGGILAAAEQGVFVIGVDQDEYNTTFGGGSSPGADKLLTSAIKRVDTSVYDQIKAVVEGTFTGGGIAVYEAANEGVGYADFHDTASVIPDGVKAKMEEILKALADGSLTTGVDPVSGQLDEATVPEPNPYTP